MAFLRSDFEKQRQIFILLGWTPNQILIHLCPEQRVFENFFKINFSETLLLILLLNELILLLNELILLLNELILLLNELTELFRNRLIVREDLRSLDCVFHLLCCHDQDYVCSTALFTSFC